MGLDPRAHAGKQQYQQFSWLPLKDRAVKLQLSSVHNIHNRAPEYLKDQYLLWLRELTRLKSQCLIPIVVLVPLVLRCQY